MSDMIQRIQAAHTWYCEATRQKLRLDPQRERLWFDFFQAGFTEFDVRKVLRYLLAEICARRRNPGAIKLSNLLFLDTFEEDLNLAGANFDPDRRLPPVPGQAPAAPRAATTAPTAQPPVRNSAAAEEAFNQFKNLKQQI